MKHLTVTVNGVAYDVTVEETAGGAPAPAAAPAPPCDAPSRGHDLKLRSILFRIVGRGMPPHGGMT